MDLVPLDSMTTVLTGSARQQVRFSVESIRL